MSHFVVYVFGDDVDDLLAPYSENLEVAPYIRYTKQQAIAEIRKEIEDYKNDTYAKFLEDPEGYKARYGHNESHIRYLEEDFPKRLNWTDEECFEEKSLWFDEDMIDEEGNLWSNYNPNSKWDWYVCGGRWDDELVTKEGGHTNEDYVSEINWDETLIPFAYVDPKGRWYDKGDMGWWGIVTNEKDQDKYTAEFKKFISKLPKDTTVTVVDCHI